VQKTLAHVIKGELRGQGGGKKEERASGIRREGTGPVADQAPQGPSDLGETRRTQKSSVARSGPVQVNRGQHLGWAGGSGNEVEVTAKGM